MPVVVTGASGVIGRAAIAAFARVSPEVRAFVRRAEPVELLRGLGAKVAVGAVDDVDTLAVVMRGAHTVCHLVGALDLPNDEAYERVNVASTMSALAAAREARVKRFLFVSYPGADPASDNAFLRTKGMAERAVAESGIDHVSLRCTHVIPGLRVIRPRRLSTAVAGPGTQRLAPVFVQDVAGVLVAADDRVHPAVGTWGLEGPDRLTADELADALGAGSLRRLHGEAAARRLGVSPTALEVLAADSLADAPDAAAEFAVERTPLREALERAPRPVLER